MHPLENYIPTLMFFLGIFLGTTVRRIYNRIQVTRKIQGKAGTQNKKEKQMAKHEIITYLVLLRNGGDSMCRDILFNTISMGIPFWANCFINGGYHAALKGSVQALINFVMAIVCTAVAAIMFFLYRRESKKSDAIMQEILARKNKPIQ